MWKQRKHKRYQFVSQYYIYSSLSIVRKHAFSAPLSGKRCFVSNHNCGLLSKCQLTACQSRNHQWERLGLSRFGHELGRVEWGWKERREGGCWLMDGMEVSAMACFIKTCQCQLIGPSFVFEGRSHEYRRRYVIASSISLMGVVVWHDVWKMVEQSVVWWREYVTTSVVVWWIEKGEMRVWKTQSHKSKKTLFSLKPLPPLLF